MIFMKKTGSEMPGPRFFITFTLDLCNVDGLIAFGALSHLKLDFLTLFKRFIAAARDCRMMYEDILTAVLTRNKTITFCVIKPLYSTLFHR